MSLTEDYQQFLQKLKQRIRNAQLKAVLSVNRELVFLYWQIGREILIKQQQQGWGAKVIDRLAKDLRSAFPEMKGSNKISQTCQPLPRAGLTGFVCKGARPCAPTCVTSPYVYPQPINYRALCITDKGWQV